MKELDPNVQVIVDAHIRRAKAGMAKYGVDTTRDDLTDEEWLVHLQEELMDAAVYVQRLLVDRKLKMDEATIQAFLRHDAGASVSKPIETVIRKFVDFVRSRTVEGKCE